MNNSISLVAGIVLFLAVAAVGSVEAQVGEWLELPNSPLVGRYNDASFVSERVGWVVNGDGEIYRTTNKGSSWRLMFSSSTTHFRSVGFVNDSLGWAGSVGLGEFNNTDPVVLRKTRDGGLTWSPVDEFDGEPPVGLCGMQVVNDSMIVSVGRVRGPAWFIKSTDAGETWQTMNLDSLAAGLIDVRFFDPDTGFVVGLTNSDHDQSSGVILATTDGGATWQRRFTTQRTGEWFWKVSFPTRRVGYVSLQRNSRTPIYFVKTTDGGLTWQKKVFSENYYFVQGIGFLTEDVGWIGGNSSRPTYETRDGGETWASAEFGSRVNRFRFLGDTLAYAVGRKIYRYDVISAVGSDQDEVPNRESLISGVSNHPNPFSTLTTIRFQIQSPAVVSLVVVDVLGREVTTLMRPQVLQPGAHQVEWDAVASSGSRMSSGLYVYRLNVDNRQISKIMVLAN